MDLYAILGIEKTADLAEIRRAYRLLSKRFHPDSKNGDRAKFEEIKRAHDILIDEDRRARYDRTGDVTERVPEGNAEAEVFNIVSEALMNAVRNVGDVETADIPAMARRYIEAKLSEVKSARKMHQQAADTWEKVIKRLKHTGKRDIATALLKGQVSNAQQMLEKLAHADEVLGKAKEILSEYKYEFDKPRYAVDRSYQGFRIP